MLDFTASNKKTLEVKLKSGKVIHIEPPTLRSINAFNSLNMKETTVEELAKIIAVLASNNKEKYEVTLDEMSDYNVMDLTEFANAIANFTTEVTSQKN